MKLKTIALGVVALSLSTGAFANIVINGGFETGALLPDWTPIPSNQGSNFSVVNNFGHNSSHSMFFGAPEFTDLIQQNLNTTPNAWYEISMWVYNQGVGNDVLFAYFQENQAIAMTPISTGLEQWEKVSVTMQANGPQQLLRIYGMDPNGFYIDDVKVQPVPEPATMATLGIGALALSWRRKRKASR